MPTFFADECVARLIVDGLRNAGLDVVDAKDVCRGDDDERVLALAASANRVVITDDWGFGELTVRQRKPSCGVVILSLHALSSGRRENYAVEQLLKIVDACVGKLTIIEPGRVRQRPLRPADQAGE